jgi:phosphohistidine phosphatase
MAVLLMLRHAHAAVGGGLDDSERTLSEDGRREALAVGGYLGRSGRNPDRVLCSPARRAQETWELVSAALPRPPEAEFEPAIYEAGPDALVGRLSDCDDATGTLLVVGHNPTLHQLTFALAGGGDEGAIDRLTTEFPPAGLVELHFPDGWTSVRPGAGTLVAFVLPRDLA